MKIFANRSLVSAIARDFKYCKENIFGGKTRRAVHQKPTIPATKPYTIKVILSEMYYYSPKKCNGKHLSQSHI